MAPLVARAPAESSDAAVSRDEQAWDAQFAGSRDVLEELHDEITADHEAGRTVPIQALERVKPSDAP